MNRIEQTVSRIANERPTIPAPAFAACRAAAIRAQIAHELLLEEQLREACARPTVPAPAIDIELDWDVES